jgi:hypothetical protein
MFIGRPKDIAAPRAGRPEARGFELAVMHHRCLAAVYGKHFLAMFALAFLVGP